MSSGCRVSDVAAAGKAGEAAEYCEAGAKAAAPGYDVYSGVSSGCSGWNPLGVKSYKVMGWYYCVKQYFYGRGPVSFTRF